MKDNFLYFCVATAPTVYGIETYRKVHLLILTFQLFWLQQHLPFTVLKPTMRAASNIIQKSVATAPTVYGIETSGDTIVSMPDIL